LCPENFKASRSGEDRLRVAGVIPKSRVAGQFLERFQEPGDVIRGIFLPERLLQILLQISKADRILPVVRVMPVGRLEEREAGRLRTGERAAEIGRDWSHHGQWDWVNPSFLWSVPICRGIGDFSGKQVRKSLIINDSVFRSPL